jgi:hypothetical protein
MAHLKVPSPQQVAKKWATVTPARVADYIAGTSDPTVDWEGPTIQAKEAYEAGVQEAIALGSREAGVAHAGTKKWRDKTTTKGARNWAPGVRAAQGAMQAGIAAPLSVLDGLEVNDRGPVSSDQNYERVRQIGQALHDDKLRRKGGGA